MIEDSNFKKFFENLIELSEKDEYMHDFEKDFGQFPPYHNESWYFNFIDRPNKVYFITRVSNHMDIKKSRILCLLIIDGERNIYFNEVNLDKMPENWEFDNKIKYYCIKPMNQWKIKFEDKKLSLDVNIRGRFPVMNFGDIESPREMIEKYGEEYLKVAAQEHYEQPIIATGALKLKKSDKLFETRNIKGMGHRDHSWGIRDWVQIDGWNWVSAQFEDMTINFNKTHVIDITTQMGVIYSKDKDNIIIKNIEVKTKTKEDGKTPISSTFILTDKNGNKKTLESKTISSVYLPLPSPKGLTEIFEQIAIFTCEDKKGNGISEYLISNRN
jgi:hypothetical protein